jgi:alkanesulfonate monooxygenase SsuD/methylene tetrahydromethanopterin reductase-like flavin-dependent oxidoreductase (luciferase family)
MAGAPSRIPAVGIVRRVRTGVVILPEYPWHAARSIWQRAEVLGFDHAWTYDHLAWRSLRDSPWFGAIPTLTAAAAATERIRLGPLVASPNFRHPVPFAKELMTLDDISAGRLTLGIGSGGEGWDASVLGEKPWTPRERADRFAEFVELTDRLLREPATSYAGTFYSADGGRTYPGCVQQPRVPFAVAATGPRAMQVAAMYADTWVTTGDRGSEMLSPVEGAAAVRAQIDALERACARVGRDPRSLGRLVLSGLRLDSGLDSAAAFAETIGRYAAVGVTDFVVHWPRAEQPFAGDTARFEAIFEARSR